MTDRPSPIELEEFELIHSAPGAALLRVTARIPFWAPRHPTLLIRDETRVHRLRPLPLPREPEGWLRAAYSVRTAVLERNPSFALELSQGAVISLPEPRGRLRRPRPSLLEPSAARTTHRQPRTTQTTPRQPSTTRTARAPGTERADSLRLLELQAKVLEANRWALDAQREVERLTARIRELEQAVAQTAPLERIRRGATEQARARDEAEVRAALAARQQRS